MKKYETVYRVVENKDSNDFNNELPYTILTFDYNPKTNLVRRKGFNNWIKHGKDCFRDKLMAEKCFVLRVINTFEVNQAKLAVEKLEEIIKVQLKILKNSYKELSDFDNGYRLACDDFKYLLESKIKELKGESYGI